MNEKKDPVLSARVDLLLLALATHVRFNPEPGFAGALRANVEMWRDGLIATPIPEGYLDELDAQLEDFLGRIRR